jgi:hypothetical protein
MADVDAAIRSPSHSHAGVNRWLRRENHAGEKSGRAGRFTIRSLDLRSKLMEVRCTPIAPELRQQSQPGGNPPSRQAARARSYCSQDFGSGGSLGDFSLHVVAWAEGPLSQETIERWAAPGSRRLILRWDTETSSRVVPCRYTFLFSPQGAHCIRSRLLPTPQQNHKGSAARLGALEVMHGLRPMAVPRAAPWGSVT